MNGILNIDKPPNLTSARVVDRVKRVLPRGIKIGHAGTLDPFATGVLLLLIGKATKLCERLMDQPKQYLGTVQLGATTATDDVESPPVPWPSLSQPDRPPDAFHVHVKYILSKFKGQIIQQPPAFSALKVGGKRAYRLARQGRAPVLQPRSVQIYDIQLLDYCWPMLKLKVDCGRGTYIRALARDIGTALDTGGFLRELRRTRVGDFNEQSIVPLEGLTSERIGHAIVPVEEVLKGL